MLFSGKLKLSHRGMRIGKGIAALACLAALVLLGQLLWTIRSAERCVESLHSLVPGKSTLADAQALQRVYGRFARISGDCSQECSIGFVFESWLSRLHMINRSQFEAHICVKNSTVAVVDLLYIKRDGIIVSFKERSAEADPASLLGFSVFVQDQRIGASKLQLTMRNTTPLEIRRTPMDVDLSCMGRVNCRNAQDIMPDLQSLRFSHHQS